LAKTQAEGGTAAEMINRVHLFVSSVVFPDEAGTIWQLCSLRRQKQNITYPHMTEICGYSLVTVFLMKVR
jgi:hypothetical protein